MHISHTRFKFTFSAAIPSQLFCGELLFFGKDFEFYNHSVLFFKTGGLT